MAGPAALLRNLITAGTDADRGSLFDLRYVDALSFPYFDAFFSFFLPATWPSQAANGEIAPSLGAASSSGAREMRCS